MSTSQANAMPTNPTKPAATRSLFRRAVDHWVGGLGLLVATCQIGQAAEVPAAPQLRIEAGMHTVAINGISTDAQGRWAVTASDDKTSRVWDVASGRLLQILRPPLGSGNEGKLNAVAITPDGAVVAVGGWTGFEWNKQASIYLFDRASGRFLQRLSGLPNTISHLAFSPNGRWLAATLSQGGLRVWRWQQPGAAPLVDSAYGDSSYRADFGPSGAQPAGQQTLVTSSDDGQIRLYRWADDAAAGSALVPAVRQVAPGGKEPYGVAFSPDGSQIAVGYQQSSRVDVLDGATLQLRFSPEIRGEVKGDLRSVAWSADGRTLAAAGGWAGRYGVRTWSQSGRGQPQEVVISSNSVMDIELLPVAAGGGWLLGSADPAWGRLDSQGRWSPMVASPIADLRGSTGDNNFLLSEGGHSVQFGFELRGEVPYRFDVRSRQLQPGTLAGGKGSRTNGLKVENWESHTVPTLNGQPLKLYNGGNYEISRSLAVLPDASGFALGTDSFLYLFNADGSNRWPPRAVPGVTWGVNIPQTGDLAGKIIVAAHDDGTVRWYRVSDGQELLAFFPHADRKRWVLWTPSGYYDASPGGEELIGWHLNRIQSDGMRVVDAPANEAAFQAGLRNGDVVRSVNSKAVFSGKDVLSAAQQLGGQGRLLLDVLRNGGELQIPVIPQLDASSGRRRFGTIEMVTDVVDVQASDFFPASRFREQFYRPDVIDRVLETLNETEAVRQADTARGNTKPSAPVNVAQALPPVVELVNGSELQASGASVLLRVRGRAANDAPVTAWRLRVNGQAVAEGEGARGLGRVDAPTAGLGAEGERSLSVPVPPRDSEIQVFAENRHGVSTPATVRVRWAGAAPAAAAVPSAAAPAPAASPGGLAAVFSSGFQIQPKLYVLAVGVGQYQNPAISRLGLPAKDAKDFAAALLRQKGSLYRDVEVKLLTDAQATADAVIDGLDWLQKQVTQHDVGMVFISGHGTNDTTLGYTYLPVNADPERLRRTGVPMDEFKKTLANLPGKALFFFDTCHSGNVLGGSQSRALTNDVSGVINELSSAENGVVVFSSSTGRQLSYEDAAWGNGAFTKALVEGIDGKADYQKSGRITHKMLDLYISERVKELTKGKQSPVTQAPGGVPDYPIAVVK